VVRILQIRRCCDQAHPGRDLLAIASPPFSSCCSNDNQQLTRSLRAAHEVCDRHNDVATASLSEVWIDESEFVLDFCQKPSPPSHSSAIISCAPTFSLLLSFNLWLRAMSAIEWIVVPPILRARSAMVSVMAKICVACSAFLCYLSLPSFCSPFRLWVYLTNR
jgi:hypothetical protein